MGFYIVLALFYAVLILFDKSVTKRVNCKMWAFVLLFPLFFMTAFKDVSVGSDTGAYSGLYNVFSQESLFAGYNYNMEIGYRALNKFLGNLNVDFFGFQILYSAFVYVILAQFIGKYSKNIAFSVFIFITFRLFFFSMTGIRQMIAIVILINSVKYIEKRQPVRYITAAILASLFHLSAIISVVLYFLPFKRLDFKGLLKITLITVPAYFAANIFIGAFMSVFPKYAHYVSRMESSEGSFVILQTGLMLSFLLLDVFFYNAKDETRQFTRGKFAIAERSDISIISLNALIFTYISNVFSLNINIAMRMSRYFSVLLIVYLPNILGEIKNPKLRILLYYATVILLLVYYVVIFIYRPGWDGVIPYRLIWN